MASSNAEIADLRALAGKLGIKENTFAVAWRATGVRPDGFANMNNSSAIFLGNCNGVLFGCKQSVTLISDELNQYRAILPGDRAVRILTGTRRGLVVMEDRLRDDEAGLPAWVFRNCVAGSAQAFDVSKKADRHLYEDIMEFQDLHMLQVEDIPIPPVYLQVTGRHPIYPRVTGHLIKALKQCPGYDPVLGASSNFTKCYNELCIDSGDIKLISSSLAGGYGGYYLDHQSVKDEVYTQIPLQALERTTTDMHVNMLHAIKENARLSC